MIWDQRVLLGSRVCMHTLKKKSGKCYSKETFKFCQVNNFLNTNCIKFLIQVDNFLCTKNYCVSFLLKMPAFSHDTSCEVKLLTNQQLSRHVWQKIFISAMCIISVYSESRCQSLILCSKKIHTFGFKVSLRSEGEQTESQMYFFNKNLEREKIVVRFFGFIKTLQGRGTEKEIDRKSLIPILFNFSFEQFTLKRDYSPPCALDLAGRRGRRR